MKIYILTAHRNTDIWSTPLSVINEFKKRGYEVKIFSLFDDFGQYNDSGHIKLLKELDTTPSDIVFHMDYGRYQSPLFEKFKKYKNTFFIMEAGDEPQNFDKNIGKGKYFNLILTPDYMSNEKYKKLGYNSLWWTHFADTTIHNTNYDITPIYNVVSSRGMGGSMFLDTLTQIIPNFINRNGFQGDEHSKFLLSGKIVLQNSRWGEITRRLFEGMACGRMVITDRLSLDTHMNDIFIENEDIVYYDNMADCISKVNYYLYNSIERNRIAKNGYENIMRNHTQENRVNVIIEEFNKWKK